MIPYPNINPVFIKLGPLQIKWYGLAYIFGILIGFLVVKKDLVEKLEFDLDQMANIACYLMLGIIFGGRLGYILFYDLPFYLKNPLEMLALWHGGMSYHGGAFGCVVALLLRDWLHNWVGVRQVIQFY
jgi:phosphatidylglycerol:prolipoprotein diacylglycerol transferase